MLLAVPSAQDLIAERYPGAMPLVEECGAMLAEHFPFASTARALIDAAHRRPTPESLCELASELEGALAALRDGRVTEEHLSPWGHLLPPRTPSDDELEPPEDPRSALPSGTERKMRRRPSDIEHVDLESQKDRDNPLVHSFEKVHTATEYESGRKQLDGSDQLAAQQEALEELELKKLTRTSETTRSIYRADLRACPDTADLADEPGPPRAHRYPEWNFKQRRYRSAWCTVHEESSPPRSPMAHVAVASRRLRSEVLRLQGELKRLRLERRWRNRQLEGTEIDIDAVIDRHATLIARRHPDPRIYVRRKLHDAELAMLVLVDASSSSDSWISGRRIFDVVRDSTQVLVEAFEPTSAKLCVAAFHSNTRRDCRFVLVKGFHDSAGEGLRRLHAVSPTGYTRIGPALRHSLEVMEGSAARRRLILLLTDAKPTDYDHYEGRYGIEDVRQALREASERGVHCLTLAVRDKAEPYLAQMFGQMSWTLLPDLGSLPGRFASVAGDFLRS
jgi:nitric oxide reductase NorD protein